MKRSVKRRNVGPGAMLAGVVLVGGALLVLFSTGRAGWLAHIPGLRSGTGEWELYRSILDRRPPAAINAGSPVLRFGTSTGVSGCIDDQQGGIWCKRWFEAEGYADTVEVRHLLDREGHLIRFKRTAPYRGRRRMELTPVNSASGRRELLRFMAGKLGLITPAASKVNVFSCGALLGERVLEERVDGDLLAGRGMRGACLVRMGMDPSRPDQQFPVIDADSAERVGLLGLIERALMDAGRGDTDMLVGIMDEPSTLAWLLMAWIDGRDLHEEPVDLIYQVSTGRFMPIYRPPVICGDGPVNGPLMSNMLTPLLRRPDIRERFMRLQSGLADRFAAMQEEFVASQSDPSLRASMLCGLSAARIADVRAVDHLDRPTVPGPGHATLAHGLVLPSPSHGAALDTAVMARLAKRYGFVSKGDTVVFPRGRFHIAHDIEFPSGTVVEILPGARLFIASGRSVFCKGDLHIRGTLLNPVFIRPMNKNEPFGSIALVGDGTRQCTVSGAFFSGAGGSELAGLRCGGMLSVHGASRTRITSTFFQGNDADASLLVEGGELYMDDVHFTEEAKTFIQLDLVRAMLRDIDMKGAHGNKTDGMHIGSGTVTILDGLQAGLNGTAVHADGRSRVLVRNTRLTGNSTALRSEGHAAMHVEGSTLDGNGVVFHAITGAPGDRFILYPNTLAGNTNERTGGGGIRDLVDMDPGIRSLFSVPSEDPGRRAPGRGGASPSGRIPTRR